MRMKTIGLLTVAAMTLAACGAGTDLGLPEDPGAPVLQVRSEGGFAPVEFVLGRGPTYTLLADGSLIHTGPTAAIFPGPVLPNYLVTQISDDQMAAVLDLAEEIGLPDFDDEIDDTANQFVADATTEVVTLWDDAGEHRYSVYALGIDPNPSNAANKAFLDLLVELDRLAASGEAVSYDGERVQVIAGEGGLMDQSDQRDWPLDDTDFSDWTTLPNGWQCNVYETDVLDRFTDATQSTQWNNPAKDGSTLTLVVRPLHPGEPDCLGN